MKSQSGFHSLKFLIENTLLLIIIFYSYHSIFCIREISISNTSSNKKVKKNSFCDVYLNSYQGASFHGCNILGKFPQQMIFYLDCCTTCIGNLPYNRGIEHRVLYTVQYFENQEILFVYHFLNVKEIF